MTSIDQFEVGVVARQPLFLRSAPRAGNRQTTSTSISGSTLRGAFAALWLADHGEPDAVFHELFETGLAWPTLRPVGHLIVPTSVRRCKYRTEPQCAATAVDTFDPQSSVTDAGVVAQCPHCGGPLELSKGDLVPTDIAAKVSTITRTSVELDDDETAKDGQLFSRDALASGTRLNGRAPLPGVLSPRATSWLNGLIGRRLRVGGRRTVAGAITIDRITWPTVPAPARATTGQFVTLSLHTPAVILDRYGATTTEPDQIIRGTVLEGHLRVLASASFVRPETIGGWNALAGLPRADDTGWAAGSTVTAEVIHSEGIRSDQWATFISEGVGTRRSEGLGVVMVGTEAWTFPEVTRPSTTVQVAPDISPLLLDLVAELDSDDRKDTADWLAGRLSNFAQQLRRDASADRAELAAAALAERRLRHYNTALVDAYYDTLSSPSNSPAELERLGRLMRVLSLPEFMQEST